MLSWFFKTRVRTDAAAAARPAAGPAVRPRTGSGAPADVAKAEPADDAGVDWPAQLQAAQGDDAALLRVARLAPRLEVKRSAVEAIVTEDVLRQAEREFRSHDRKVHRVAKQRLDAAVAQREARARAQVLLERAAALLGEPLVAVNHVVVLDRDWAALPAHGLEPAQQERYTELRARLDATMRERGDEEQRVRRWTSDARRLLRDWPGALAETAAGGATSDVARLRQGLQALLAARPQGAATAELEQALAQALQLACGVEAHLAWFELPPAPDDRRPGAAAAPPGTGGASIDDRSASPAGDDGSEAPAPAPASADPEPAAIAPQWDDLAPLADDELARVLKQRHDRWLRAHRPVSPPPAAAPRVAVQPPPTPAPTAPQRLRLENLLQQAEAALAEGQLRAMQRHLQGIDAALAAPNAPALPDAWRTRHQVLRIERDRLKGWQQWGGGRARDDLAGEAEELARRTLAAADAAAPERPKLNLKSHAESIHALRLRWKELDRLGAAATPALWQRFDAALQAAFQPVAAQHATLAAAREANLQARGALLAALEALPVPDRSEPVAATEADWRALQRELERFQLAWRKLGPVEHTVPSAAREALQQRLRAGVERIEAPLREVHRAHADAREQLVARAVALTPAAGRAASALDATRQVRELQAQWQDQARRMALPHALESDLWARFKAATDAVFAARDAQWAARDEALAANLAAREALLERLAAVGDDTPRAELQRMLAEVDRAWRQAGEVRRDAAETIEARFRTARAAASQHLDAAARRQWQAHCDLLAAKLGLCEARERGDAPGTELDPRWAAQDALPGPWEQALAQRWAAAGGSGPLPAAAIDDLLLQLEIALDLPPTPEWQDARRQLKLRELKQAMEGRGPVAQGPAPQAQWLLAALRQGDVSAAQRERLHAVVAALRRSPPGALGMAA